MPRVNRTRFAILGMLISGPKSGYDLKQEFEERIGHFWSESLGQIYPTLHRLHDEALVSASVQRRTGRPERKVYRITPSGRRVFEEWLDEPAAPMGVRNELLLKVYFGTQMSPAQVLAHIDRFEAAQNELSSLYKVFEEQIRQLAVSPEQQVYWQLALSSGSHVNRARLAWCREARAAVGALTMQPSSESGATQ